MSGDSIAQPPPQGNYKRAYQEEQSQSNTSNTNTADIAGIRAIYPNPFMNETVIEFRTVEPGEVLLKIADMSGRDIKTLFNGVLKKGNNIATLFNEAMATGEYMCILFINGKTVSMEKIVLNK